MNPIRGIESSGTAPDEAEVIIRIPSGELKGDLAERYADRLAVLEKALTLGIKSLKAELIHLTARDLTDITPIPKLKGKVEEQMPEAPAGPEEAEREGAGGEEGAVPAA